MEDAGMLVDLLEKHNPSAGAPSTETLTTVFSEFVKVRLPHTAALVKQARAQGDGRVASGVEECIKRNNHFREICSDPVKLKERFGV